MDRRPWHAHYPPGVPPSLEYERLTLFAMLERSAARHPTATAVAFQNARLTYAELLDAVHRMATALAGLGVRKGSRIAIQTPNLPQTVIAYFGALRAGAEVVMTNPLYTPPEIEHQWKDAGCELVVTMDYLYEQKIRALRDRLPAVRNFVLASIPEYLRFPLNLLAPFALRRRSPAAIADVPAEPGVHAFRELVRGTAPDPPRVDISWDDVALLQYTGGTTGVSKAAVLTHANLGSNVQQVHAWFRVADGGGGRNVILTALPLFHVFGLTVCMNWGAFDAATMVLVADPRDVRSVVKAIKRNRVTIFPGVPAMFAALNELPGIESRDVSSVRSCFSGSAPITLDVLQRFEELTGARILEGFGLSETSPVTHVNPIVGERKIGTVGLPVPDTDARIVDVEEGTRELPTGEEGELCLRGPQVMRGYWNQPEETAAALKDGWLHTGDLAVVDADGFFRIVGRKKEMINVNGLKVFPDEVDAVLTAHPDVLESATIGVPDPKRIEHVKSFVVRRPGTSLTAADLQAHCRESLAAYKVPREVEFLEELPRSSVLKVLRRELREREIRRLSADAAAG